METSTSHTRRLDVRKSYIVAVCAIHFGLLVWGIFVHGPCWDEVGHLPAGLSHWRTSQFELYRVNPPFVRMLATAPFAFEELKVDFNFNPIYTLDSREWSYGRELMQAYGTDYLRLLRISRLVCLVFSLIALRIIWKWSHDLFGSTGAMLSITVWAFSPLVLTNGQLLTPDMATTALGTVACYSFRNWLLDKSKKTVFLAGITLGLVMLTKFSWVILFGLWPLQWSLQRLISNESRLDYKVWFAEAIQFLLIFSISLFVINLGYGFQGSFLKLKQYSFYSNPLTGDHTETFDDKVSGNRFAGSLLGEVFVPFPREMVLGIDRQKVDFEIGMLSYLRGEWRDHGWWYYYLYGILVKVPVPFLLLGCLAAIQALTMKWTKLGIMETTHLLIPAAAVLFFVSSQSGFNHHIRYVLPAFSFCVISLGVLQRLPNQERKFFPKIVWGLALLGALSSVANSPHWHSHFNLLVGGPKNGPLHLLDSNVDWGQDILLFEKWAKAHPDKPFDGVKHALPRAIGIYSLTETTDEAVPTGFPQSASSEEQQLNADHTVGPRPGRYALSVLYIYRDDSGYGYFRKLKPFATVGHTMKLYEIDISEANRIRRELGYTLLKDE